MGRACPGATCGNVALYGLTVNRYAGLMDEHRDDFPQVRLSDALNGDGFPAHGPRTPLSDAVIDDALERLQAQHTPVVVVRCSCGADANGVAAYTAHMDAMKAQTRAAKEITAAWHDPHWLDEH